MDKEVTCAQIENAIKNSCDYITSIELFDIYEGAQLGEDKKSMAFSVVFTPGETEFTSEIIDGFVADILKKLQDELNVSLRA